MFTITNKNSNYLAKIVQIDKFEPHPNADKLKLAVVDGYKIATSIDTQSGVFIYFPLECKINHDYLSKNNLYRNKKDCDSLNENPEISGFFEENGRVRCLKLRGVVSEGLIMPIDSIKVLTHKVLIYNVNIEFDTVDGKEFVTKYIPKVQHYSFNPREFSKKNKKQLSIIDNQFRFHVHTGQFKKNLFKFTPNTKVVITEKWHGTSAIFCNLLTKKRLNIFKRVAKFIGFNVIDTEYKVFCSSRTVIKNPKLTGKQSNGYYSSDIWNLALDVVKDFISEGVSIYAEIVGYLPTGGYIQKDYDYGCVYDPIKYDYSTMTGKEMYESNLFKIRVYRVTYTNETGKVIESNDATLRDFCELIDLEPVIHLWEGKISDFESSETVDDFLESVSNKYLEKHCKHCNNKVPAEGIVIRLNDVNYFEAYKLKSQSFLLKETIELDNNTIDIEANE